MNMEIKVKAYAKVNLLLDIISKLPNGYHNLFTVMQSVSLFDTLTVRKTESGGIVIRCAAEGVPEDETNIAYKAAEAFFDFYSIDDHSIEIEIIKNIPHAAGLAGGSADGAAVFRALCSLYGVKPTPSQAVKILSPVGADLPFCYCGGTALCQYIGNVISPLPELPECFIVIAKPEQAVPTKGAYAHYDEISSRVRHPDNYGMLHAVMKSEMNEIAKRCYNVFEQAIEVCDRADIKGVLRSCGALAGCMSGSGPSVFGIFDNKESAEKAVSALKKTVKEVYLTSPVPYGTEIV